MIQAVPRVKGTIDSQMADTFSSGCAIDYIKNVEIKKTTTKLCVLPEFLK